MQSLRSGARGDDVIALQSALNILGAGLRVDGDFGKKTDAAVRSFQAAYGLVIDGRAGEQTLTALREATIPAGPARGEPDKSGMASAPPSGGRTGAAAAPPSNAGALALLKTARPISEIIVHCAATPEGMDYSVADIRAWHKARGFSDIGYHYVVYRDGRVFAGRPIGQVGAHVSGRNTGTIGICYVGGLTADGKAAKDTRTDGQRASLLWLKEQLIRIHPGIAAVSGHNAYAAKACPSFDVGADELGRPCS